MNQSKLKYKHVADEKRGKMLASERRPRTGWKPGASFLKPIM